MKGYCEHSDEKPVYLGLRVSLHHLDREMTIVQLVDYVHHQLDINCPSDWEIDVEVEEHA